MSLSPRAEKSLSKDRPSLELQEYPTTQGLTLVLPSGDYVQAKFTGKFNNPCIQLDEENGHYFLEQANQKTEVEVLPMLDFVGKKNQDSFLYEDIVVTFGDRMRISPVKGCAFHCQYCTVPNLNYTCLPVPWLLDAINVAASDTNLKPRHLLISGGTPLARDRIYLDQVYKEVTEHLSSNNIGVEVMLSPRPEEGFLKKLKSYGVEAVVVNLEIWNENLAKRYNPQKVLITKKSYLDFLTEAVEVFGRGQLDLV